MPGKRGNSEGSIRKRSEEDRWEARYVDVDGKRQSIYGQTRQEVARLLTQALRNREQGLKVLDERQTVGQYLASWIETVKPQIRNSSWRRYGDYVRVHLTPELGRISLVQLSPQHLQVFYARELNRGLSSSTVHHIHGMLHRALKDAMLMGLVQRNVAELVRAPRRSSKEMKTLSEDQSHVFLKAAETDRFRALYILALTTGMREGELLGLRWQDIDLERANLQVRLNVQEQEGGFALAELKTTYSRRNIALSYTAIEALQTHRTQQNTERLRVGPAWESKHDLVFPNTVGGLMIPDNMVKRSFKPLLAKAGLPDMRFHDLRHTAATLLLSRGVHPKVVSEMLGHADISITLRVYAHVTPHMQQAAVAVMDALFHQDLRQDLRQDVKNNA